MTVAGNHNRVALMQAAQIATPGNGNIVSYTAGSPQVANAGSRNVVSGPGPANRAGATAADKTSRGGTHVSDGAGNSV